MSATSVVIHLLMELTRSGLGVMAMVQNIGRNTVSFRPVKVLSIQVQYVSLLNINLCDDKGMSGWHRNFPVISVYGSKDHIFRLKMTPKDWFCLSF